MWYMNEERELLVKAFREFAEQEIRPIVDKMEKQDEYPVEALRTMGQLGFIGLGIDQRGVGGEAADYVNFGLMIEECAKVSHGFALLAYAAQTALGLYEKVFTPEQIETIMKPALAGKLIISDPINEPCGIFNPAEYETTAVLDGDEWVINGCKVLISSIDVADLHIAVCRTSEKFDPVTMRGLSAFAIPANTPGIEIGHIEDKLGWHGSRTGTIYFNDVRIPKENLVGELDNIWGPVLLGRFSQEIVAYGPMNLGAMETCFEKTKHFLQNRIQNGVSLWDAHEVIRNDMARIWIKITNYRNAVYAVLEEKNRGEDVFASAIALKVEGEALLRNITSDCIDFHGGTGTVYETDVERFYRDAKMGAIGCGSVKTYINTLSSMI